MSKESSLRISLLWTVIHGLISLFFAWKAYKNGLPIPLIAPDTLEHTQPVYYLIKLGRYWPDTRPPSLGILYGAFYLTTGKNYLSIFLTALSVLFMILFSVFITLRELYLYTSNIWVVHLAGIIWTTTPIAHYWYWIVPDPLMTGINALAVITLLNRKYTLAGIIISLLFLLRFIYGILLPVVSIYILVLETWPLSLRKVIHFTLPFVLIEGAWITRNFIQYKDFRPFFGSKTETNMFGNEPLASASKLYRHLGTGGADSPILGMLCALSPVDRQAFFNMIPQKYLSEKEKEIITDHLNSLEKYMINSDERNKCKIEIEVKNTSERIIQEVDIPWYVTRWNTMKMALFSQSIYESRSSSPLDWIGRIKSLPIYLWASLSFLLYLFSSILALGLYIRTQGKNIGKEYIIWHIFSYTLIISYYLVGFAEHRYLVQHTPLLGIGNVLCFFGYYSSMRKR